MVSSGRLTGSRASTEPCSTVSALTGFDPERVAARAANIRQNDAYLISYLLGWAGLAKPEPWGAAMSFALEMAAGYRLIKGESDATLTPFGSAVALVLSETPNGD